VAIGWAVVGFYGGFGGVAVAATVKESLLTGLFIGLGFLGLILFQSYINLTIDKKIGRVDAIDKSEIEYWRAKATRLGMSIGEKVQTKP